MYRHDRDRAGDRGRGEPPGGGELGFEQSTDERGERADEREDDEQHGEADAAVGPDGCGHAGAITGGDLVRSITAGAVAAHSRIVAADRQPISSDRESIPDRMNRTRAVVLSVVVLAAIGGAAVLTVDRPSVAGTESRFAGVNDSTTLVTTELRVTNPNPIPIELGNTTVTHSIRMNGIEMGTGSRDDIRAAPGTSTVNFTTAIDNRNIPAWWASHVERGERTRVVTGAAVDVPVFGTARVSKNRTLTTDITGALNTSESRPINASLPFVDDPVLVVERTSATWGNVTRATTPLDIALRVRNPSEIPIPVARIDYTLTMNGIAVGNGTTGEGTVLSPGSEQTITAGAAIRNDELDDWWVSHIERGQRTDLGISLTAVLELPDNRTVELPLDDLGGNTTIDTDVFDAGNGSTGSTSSIRLTG